MMTKVNDIIFIYQEHSMFHVLCRLHLLSLIFIIVWQDRGTCFLFYQETQPQLGFGPADWDLDLALFGNIT